MATARRSIQTDSPRSLTIPGSFPVSVRPRAWWAASVTSEPRLAREMGLTRGQQTRWDPPRPKWWLEQSWGFIRRTKSTNATIPRTVRASCGWLGGCAVRISNAPFWGGSGFQTCFVAFWGAKTARGFDPRWAEMEQQEKQFECDLDRLFDHSQNFVRN